MTTIVVDSKIGYMAADRMATSNDCDVCIECPKIKRVTLSDGDHLMASAGHEGSAQIFEEWYESDDDECLDPLEDMEDIDKFTTVILTPAHEIWLADHFYRMYRVHSRWYAAGRGSSFACAILEAGCGIE